MRSITENQKKECAELQRTIEENERIINELLTNPLVSEFFRLYSKNKKIKQELSKKQQRLSYLEMNECQHAFIITGIEKDWESGRTTKNPIYHCIKCGLTNKYDVTETSDLVDGIESQMGYIFADTAKNGVLLCNQTISLEDALSTYKKIMMINPNITIWGLKSIFPNILTEIQTKRTENRPELVKKINMKDVN